MPKQGETFINAIGVEVEAHGGSTPAVSDLEAAQANAIPPPAGQAIDVLGRVYDERVPAFFSTGTPFVIDRLRHPHNKRGNGGRTYRYLTFASLDTIKDSENHIWGPNEFGVPPQWWLEENPSYQDDIGWGYDGISPYGPEYGNNPSGHASWVRIGPNSYSWSVDGTGGQWNTLNFKTPDGGTYDVEFYCAVWDGQPGRLVFRAGQNVSDDIEVTGVGWYRATQNFPADDPPMRLTWITDSTDAYVEIHNVRIRSQAPPALVAAPIITGPADEPGILVCDGGEWIGAEVLTYQWYRDGVQINNTTDSYTTGFFDSETSFRCDVTAENANGVVGPVQSNIFTTDEFGALDTLGFDFSDLSTLWQDDAGTIPVENEGDPIGRIDGVGLTMIQSDDAMRPTLQMVNGLGAALHDPNFTQHLTTGPVGANIVEGNTVSIFYVFRFNSWLVNNEGAFSMGNSAQGTDWQGAGAIVTWQDPDGNAELYRGGRTAGDTADNVCVGNTQTASPTLMMIEYHCTPTENRVLVNGVKIPPEQYDSDAPSALPLTVDYISTACRYNTVLERFGDVTFCEFQFQANMPLEDQDELRNDLLVKWGLAAPRDPRDLPDVLWMTVGVGTDNDPENSNGVGFYRYQYGVIDPNVFNGKEFSLMNIRDSDGKFIVGGPGPDPWPGSEGGIDVYFQLESEIVKASVTWTGSGYASVGTYEELAEKLKARAGDNIRVYLDWIP